MEPQIKFNLNEIQNIEAFIQSQVKKFQNLRELVKDLKFVAVDPVGAYSSITYKSIDGGKMGINFDPFEFDFIVIADSEGNELINYLVPKSESLVPTDFQYMDKFYQIKPCNDRNRDGNNWNYETIQRARFETLLII